MIDSTAGLAALIALIVFMFVAALFGRWMLEPVNRAAGDLNAPTRFILTDFIWLMIMLQVMLATALVQIREQVSQRGQFVILGLLALPVIILWAASVSVVSRAGITQPLRRAVLILVLVPGALAEIMAVPILLIGAYLAVTADPGDWAARAWSESLPFRLVSLAAAVSLAALWAMALRWLSFWVLAASATNTAVAMQASEASPGARPS
ncbi:MAG: hypothetical protein L0211_21210 [Planctomycetaceae bacterium]|nr:hypothetical protein [Planctomycetaceae bacterium]